MAAYLVPVAQSLTLVNIVRLLLGHVLFLEANFDEDHGTQGPQSEHDKGKSGQNLRDEKRDEVAYDVGNGASKLLQYLR